MAHKFPDSASAPRAPEGDAALLALAERLRARGDDATADLLVAEAGRLEAERTRFRERVAESLAVNHDVNNALVGIFGNAQLLGLGPAGQVPGVGDRLAVITREANRIKEAVQRITELKHEILRRPGEQEAA